MDEWLDIEEKCEGKTIYILSATSSGMIIRFTDGSSLKFIGGTLRFEEKGEDIN